MDDRSSNVACRQCAAPVGPDARFCSNCGAPLRPGAVQPALVPAPDAQRRRVTVLFADMTGFTALTTRHDPEDVRTVIDRYLTLGREAVERWGGRVDQYLGDGIMAVFGDQVTREDDAERAVRAALDIRAGTPLIEHGLGRDIDALTTHIGIATGMAVTADAAHGLGVTAPLGTVVNLAARLQSLAEASEILTCGATAALVTAAIDTTPTGTRTLKGLDRPVDVHRVEQVRRTASDRRMTELVGRSDELAALGGAVDTLVARRTGAAVVVVAEAGAGKTRLVREVRTAALARHGAGLAWLEGRGSSMGASSPYAPVVEILLAMAGIADLDEPEAVSARLHDLVDGLGLGDDDVVGPLLRLIGLADPVEAALDRESYQSRLTRAVIALVRSAARRSAVVVCLQDLHWFDPSTIGLVRTMIPELRSDVVFLLNSRPVAHPPLTGVADELRLADLDADDVASLIASRFGGVPDAHLAAFVYERAGGNAFFVEEVLNRLVDEDAVEPGAGGWALRVGATRRDVPDTVQGVIAARLDLLPADARTRLRHAAVYGRVFTVDDLLGIDADPDPGPALAELVRSDLVRPDAGGRRYEFKHALTLDVTLAGLTKPERRRLHLAAARSIEHRLGERANDAAEVVGAHYLEAAEIEPTVRYLSIAAERALDRYAIDEAESLYGSAYRLLVDAAAADRRTHLGPLLVRWVLVHYYRGTWRQATDLLALHDDDITANDDPGVLGLALAWRGFSAAIARAAIDEALALLDRAVGIGERIDDPVVLAHAHTWRIWARFLGGRHDEALADGRRVDALLDRLDDPRYAAIKSAGAVGLAHIGAGDFAAARRTAEWLIATGTTTGSTRAAAMGESVLSLAATLSNDAANGADHGRRAVAAATDPIYRDMARLMAVHGMVAAGQVDAARDMHDDLVESCTALGLDGLVLAASSAHGVIRVLDGDLTGGMRELDEAIDRARRAGSEFLASLGRLYRASVRSRSVTREVTVPLLTIVRNPRFVARHAIPARRSAADDLEALIGELATQGGAGLRWLASLELAKVHLARGDRAGADRVLARARAWMPDLPPTSAADLVEV